MLSLTLSCPLICFSGERTAGSVHLFYQLFSLCRMSHLLPWTAREVEARLFLRPQINSHIKGTKGQAIRPCFRSCSSLFTAYISQTYGSAASLKQLRRETSLYKPPFPMTTFGSLHTLNKQVRQRVFCPSLSNQIFASI